MPRNLVASEPLLGQLHHLVKGPRAHRHTLDPVRDGLVGRLA